LNRSALIGRGLEKVLILPLMIAPVSVGGIWKLMFNPQFGVLNHILGLGSTFDWLSAFTTHGRNDMTGLHNDPARFTEDMLAGFLDANADYVVGVPGEWSEPRPPT
jgi:hypothetical protein